MPRFTHDHAEAVFLGEYRQYDLYWDVDCFDEPALIARYGNDPCENLSGSANYLQYAPPMLLEAAKLAAEKGLRLA